MSDPNSPLKWQMYMRRYISRLYERGYPPTNDDLREFNRTFLENTHLTEEKNQRLEGMINNLNTSIKNNIPPYYWKENSKMRLKFNELADDCKRKLKPLPTWNRKPTTNSPHRSSGSVSTVTQDQSNSVPTKTETLEKQLGELQDAYAKLEAGHLKKIAEMEKEMARQSDDMKKENEDITKNLAQKEEQLYLMRKEMHKMKKILAKVEDDRQNERSHHAMAMKFLEEKVRSLEEAVKEKSEVLKTCLRMQETLLNSVINKPTPSDSFH